MQNPVQNIVKGCTRPKTLKLNGQSPTSFLKDREIRRMIGHKKNGSGSSAHKNLERHLLSVTFVSLMVYRVFCIIAAVSQDKVKYSDENEVVLLLGERHYESLFFQSTIL